MTWGTTSLAAWWRNSVALESPRIDYRRLFDENPEPMCVFEARSRRILHANPAALGAWALGRESLLATTVDEISAPVSTQLIDGTAIGLCVPSHAVAREASDKALREVNEQVLLSGLREHAAREEAERAHMAKDEFLAVVSHELRTPLQAVLGWTALLRSGALGPAKTAHAYEVIERNARIQAQLVADLLDVSRATSGKLHLQLWPLDLREAVAAALESVVAEAARKGVRLHKPPEGVAIIVLGDSLRMEQVMVNLLSNAIKFTPAQGSVCVEIDAAAGAARLCVSDTGEGFAPEFVERMFKPFSQSDSQSTRSHGGLGLGLMIVKLLAEAHGGRVWAESAGKGTGAKFFVALPLHAGLRAAGRAGGDEAPAPSDGLLRGLRALIVDDHADSRELIHAVLRGGGAEVHDAGSAGEALARLAEWPVDIIVSDLSMPEVDGYAFLRSLRASAGPGREVPVVALSAYAGAEDRKRALAAGFCAHAAKPIDPRQLVQVVAHAAGRAA